MAENKGKVFSNTVINWYPGHMAKTKRQIIENIKLIDIIYELVDARVPYSSKLQDVDEIIKNKKKILVMTKTDLCNINMTNKWVNYYEKKGFSVLLLNLKDSNDYQKLINLTKKLTEDIQEKRKAKGLKPKEINALVIGIPNVGKSTLINKLAHKNVVRSENRPGVTQNLNFIKTSYGITLLDTPGILWPKFTNQTVALNLASIGSIKKEILNIQDVAIHIIDIYVKYYPEVLQQIYNTRVNNSLTILENLTEKWKFCENNQLNLSKTSEKIYNDLMSGKVKNVTLDICN